MVVGSSTVCHPLNTSGGPVGVVADACALLVPASEAELGDEVL